jgi:hypothetical protein
MKLSNRICIVLGLSLLPLLSEAHPGHEGNHTLSLSNLILTLAAGYFLKQTIVAIGNAAAVRRTRGLE